MLIFFKLTSDRSRRLSFSANNSDDIDNTIIEEIKLFESNAPKNKAEVYLFPTLPLWIFPVKPQINQINQIWNAVYPKNLITLNLLFLYHGLS